MRSYGQVVLLRAEGALLVFCLLQLPVVGLNSVLVVSLPPVRVVVKIVPELPASSLSWWTWSHVLVARSTRSRFLTGFD